MKKETSVFNELFSQYNEYAERKAKKLHDIEISTEKAYREMDEIQQKLKKGAAAMTSEEYRANNKRLNELANDILVYQEQTELIEKSHGTTDEEYKAWTDVISKESDRIKAEVQTETYKLLKQFAEFYEKEITEFEKLRSLLYSFEHAVGNRKGDFQFVIPTMPPYVKCICRVLLIYYNELEELINNGEHKTTCIDMDEIRKARLEISETGGKVGYPQLKEMDVPTWDEAYNEIKYNKAWTV
ncbi:MAG: hypothetical protein IKF58_16610 [Bacillus sp. (in: Bacteria)]|nr:hypothetical protein [Bacillus sp. (in: firmicutes)]